MASSTGPGSKYGCLSMNKINGKRWYCRLCGSTEIDHDAVVRYNPSGEFEIQAILDDPWCASCMEQNINERGDPVFEDPDSGQ